MNTPQSINPIKSKFTREQLHQRHRLTHRQIDDLYGEMRSSTAKDNLVQELSKLAEFILITDALKVVDISFISFKGPLLSLKIYNDATNRYYKDIDLLLDQKDVEKAVSLLIKEGYQIDGEELLENSCKLNLWFDHHNQISLSHPAKLVSVELHWQLFSVNFLSKNTIYNLIASHTKSQEFQKRNFNVLSHEFEIIYLIYHAANHHWCRLKWLVDIHEIIQRYPLDDKKFLQLVEEMKIGKLVAACNDLLVHFFPGSKQLPCNDKVPQNHVESSIKAINAEKISELTTLQEYIKFYWKFSSLTPTYRYKLNVIKKVLFASDLAAKNWMPCSALLNYLFGPFWKIFRGIRLG